MMMYVSSNNMGNCSTESEKKKGYWLVGNNNPTEFLLLYVILSFWSKQPGPGDYYQGYYLEGWKIMGKQS